LIFQGAFFIRLPLLILGGKNMSCKNVCKLCKNLVISQSVVFTAGTGLIINIPAGSYSDCERVCIVVAQTIPNATTITAPVFITIGDGTVLYPLNKCDCTQATACSIRTRTKYSTRVETNATSGVFKLIGKIPCSPNNNLTAIDGTAPTPVAGA
jgi:hypothetical protein